MIRGCCAGLVLVIVAMGGLATVTVRAASRPDLGGPPGGERHGGTPAAIAAALVATAVADLGREPHAVVALTERDLTVIARSRNLRSGRFRDPEARVRDGRVVLAGGSSLGPVDTVMVVRLAVGLNRAAGGGPPGVVATVEGVAIGTLPVPDWAREMVGPGADQTLSLDHLFDGASLSAVRENLDCVMVGGEGLRIGVHRPLSPADPQACATP